jgi:flavin reductase
MTDTLNPETARAAFVNAMGAAVTGVHIVTTEGEAGRLGLTVSAVSSVSADPPMLLACIQRRSPIVAAIQANGVFAVNALADAQVAIADTFAGRPGQGRPYDFACATWDSGGLGAPLLQDAAARFECRLITSQAAGSHSVLVGRVLRADRTRSTALAYTGRSYARPLRLAA